MAHASQVPAAGHTVVVPASGLVPAAIGQNARVPDEHHPTLPPDPAQYDTERSELARRRGLKAPYIAGGRDPDPEAGRAEERRLLRLLLIMVGAVVLSGFVLGILGDLVSGQ